MITIAILMARITYFVTLTRARSRERARRAAGDWAGDWALVKVTYFEL